MVTISLPHSLSSQPHPKMSSPQRPTSVFRGDSALRGRGSIIRRFTKLRCAPDPFGMGHIGVERVRRVECRVRVRYFTPCAVFFCLDTACLCLESHFRLLPVLWGDIRHDPCSDNSPYRVVIFIWRTYLWCGGSWQYDIFTPGSCSLPRSVHPG